jgi:hypothetical protein
LVDAITLQRADRNLIYRFPVVPRGCVREVLARRDKKEIPQEMSSVRLKTAGVLQMERSPGSDKIVSPEG